MDYISVTCKSLPLHVEVYNPSAVVVIIYIVVPPDTLREELDRQTTLQYVHASRSNGIIEGLPLFEDGATCPLCGPQEPLDKLGHHATTCKRGPHVCRRHSVLRDVLFELFSRALLSPELEKGSGMDHSHSQTRPADILVPSWSIGNLLPVMSQL